MKKKQLIEAVVRRLLQESHFDYEISNSQNVFTSQKEFTEFRNVEQPKNAFVKPNGLWYACGDDWIDWLQMEMPGRLERENFLYELELDYDHILKLETPEQISKFSNMFCGKGRISDMIDWEKVAKLYSGIEICPYQYERRMDTMWYYSWNVASGCVWDKKAFKGVKLLATKGNKANNRPEDDEKVQIGEISDGRRGDPYPGRAIPQEKDSKKPRIPKQKKK